MLEDETVAVGVVEDRLDGPRLPLGRLVERDTLGLELAGGWRSTLLARTLPALLARLAAH